MSLHSQSPGGARLSLSPPGERPAFLANPPSTPGPVTPTQASQYSSAMTTLMTTPTFYASTAYNGSGPQSGSYHGNTPSRMSVLPSPAQSGYAGNVNPLTQEIHSHCQGAHMRLMGLQTALKRQSGSLISQLIKGVNADIQEVSTNLVAIGKLASDLSSETVNLKASIRELQAKMTSMLDTEAEHKQFLSEHKQLLRTLDRLQAQVHDSEHEASRERERSKDLIFRVEEMQQTKQILEQQLAGKRSLWMSASKDLKAQEVAIESVLAGNPNWALVRRSQSPVSTLTRPSTAYTSGGVSSSNLSQGFPPGGRSNALNVGNWRDTNAGKATGYELNGGYYGMKSPARPQSCAPGAFQNKQFTPYRPQMGAHRANHPAPAPSVGDPSPSRALVSYGHGQVNDDNESQMWAGRFDNIFDTIAHWIEAYVAPEHVDVTTKCRNNPRLWEYMCSVTYPGRPIEGDSHSAFLLSQDLTRKCFIQRLMIQHVVRSIWDITMWFGLNEDTDRQLRETQEAMKTTEAFRNLERQEIVDRQSQLVQNIMDSPQFLQFRQKKTTAMTEQFKQILGAVVNPEVSREDAANALIDIVWMAFEMSGNMFMSRLHFGFVWNDTCSKFSHESHIAKNAGSVDGMTLQLRQMRLMLVITPGITTRRDTGISIVPKRILKSNVLIMN